MGKPFAGPTAHIVAHVAADSLSKLSRPGLAISFGKTWYASADLGTHQASLTLLVS